MEKNKFYGSEVSFWPDPDDIIKNIKKDPSLIRKYEEFIWISTSMGLNAFKKRLDLVEHKRIRGPEKI